MGGRLKREGTFVYLWLIRVDIWQKLIQHCKAVNPFYLKFIKNLEIKFLKRA